MSEFIEIDPGQEGDDQDWNAISEFVTHLAEANENLDAQETPEPRNESQPPKVSSQPEIQNSDNYTYSMSDFGATSNNFQYIRKEVHELLHELGEIRAARADLQDRLHNLNI